MNVFKHKLIAVFTILCTLALTACNHPSAESDKSDISDFTDVSDTSSISDTSNFSDTSDSLGISVPDNTSNESLYLPDNNKTEMVKKLYDVELPVVSANEVLQMTKLDLPEQIEGHSFVIDLLIDDKTLVISLFDRQGASGIDRGTGLYNTETKEYRAMPGIPLQGYEAFNSDYIVYKEYDNDFTATDADKSVKLFLYDLNTQKEKLIYTYSFDRNVELYGGHWIENIVLSDNKIYFDDFVKDTNTEDNGSAVWNTFLYVYDIQTGNLEKLRDNAENPMEYKDTILYITKENDQLKIDSLNGKYKAELKGSIEYFMPQKENIFTLEVLSYDDMTVTERGIKNIFTGEYILKTDRLISNPDCGDIFMAFTDFERDYLPIMYNSEGNNFVLFEELIGKNVGWYFCSGAGIVYTTGETCEAYIFKLK